MRARENPFAAERIHQLSYVPRDLSWDEIWQRWELARYRGLIWGAEGSGKTTLLLELAGRLEQSGWHVVQYCINESQPRLPSDFAARVWTAQHVVLLDGADRLGSLAWSYFRWKVRAAGGLILTAHRPGRLPTLVHCRTDARLLERLVDQLLQREAAQRPGGLGEASKSLRDDCDRLWERHQGNVRDAFRELYDWAADDQLPDWAEAG